MRNPHAATSFLATLLPWCFPEVPPVPAAEVLQARPRQDGGDTPNVPRLARLREEEEEEEMGPPQGRACRVLLARGSAQRQGCRPA